MAAGDLLLDADGNLVLDADGNLGIHDGVTDACCCGYIQAKKCSDDTLADVWMTVEDANTLPGAFNLEDVCYYFNLADEPSNSPGTVYTPADVTASDDCVDCENPPAPCEDCDTLTQPDVTVSGTFGTNELGQSCDINGTHAFHDFHNFPGGCAWTWADVDNDILVAVAYNNDTGKWSVTTNTSHSEQNAYENDDADLTCIDGVITGTVVCASLPTCPGIATVVFG